MVSLNKSQLHTKRFKLGSGNFGRVPGGAGTIKLYIDGALIGTTSGVSGWETPSTFTIGNEWSGFIDEVRLFNYALTHDEITNQRIDSTNYTGLLPDLSPASSTVKSRYRFDLSGDFLLNTGILTNRAITINGIATNGVKGGALFFNGVNSQLFAPSASINSTFGTIAFGARPDSYNEITEGHESFLLGHTSLPAFSSRIQIYLNSGKGKINVGFGINNTLMRDLFFLPEDKWSHLAISWNETNVTIYHNGIPIRSAMHTGLGYLSQLTAFGFDGNTNSPAGFFRGAIDEIVMIRGKLSDEEVFSLYLADTDRVISEGSEQFASSHVPKLFFPSKTNEMFFLLLSDKYSSEHAHLFNYLD